MLKMLRNRIQDDKGFTLIELMVVVLIIAILIAIAIPTFLGLRERAQDRAAQAELRDGLTAAKAYYTDDESYDPAGAEIFNAAEAEDVEPSLTWGAAGSTTAIGIYVLDAGDSVVLSRESESDNGWFCAMDTANESSVRGPVAAEPATVAACTAGDEV
jgi:type IV pilus assembly protein PilA